MATIEKRIAELERLHGATGYKIVFRDDNETDDEALKRARLTDWRGGVIFFNEIDVRL